MSVNVGILERVIIGAERHDVGWPALEFGPIIYAAVAGATLREVITGSKKLPDKVVWVGMSCRPREIASWQGVKLEESQSSDFEPVWFALPAVVGETIERMISASRLGHGESSFEPLAIRDGEEIVPLPAVSTIYLRCSSMDLPEPQGRVKIAWLCGASGRLSKMEEARADIAISHAERVVGDRVLHGLGGYRPVATILASIDDGFQRSMLLARSASGLSEFLEELSAESERLNNTEEWAKSGTDPDLAGKTDEDTVALGHANTGVEGALVRQQEATVTTTRDQVFISYAHEDRKWLERLQVVLRPLVRAKTISVWDDTKIKPGARWHPEIRNGLARAKIAVLLVSPAFLGSDFIDANELPPLLTAAERQGAQILWVPVRSSLVESTRIAEYQAVISPSKPLAAMTEAEQDEALVKIAKVIADAFA